MSRNTRVVINALDFGAAGDGVTDDSPALQAALEALRQAGGGQLILPGRQRPYRIRRPLYLISNLILSLQAGATIRPIYFNDVNNSSLLSWPLTAGIPNHQPAKPRAVSPIHGRHVHNVTIVGQGHSSVLDGNGQVWWERHNHNKKLYYGRPFLLEFMHSRDVVLQDFLMQDSPSWHNHFFDCQNVHVRGVAIQAPEHSPNTDGWDPNSSRNVLIEDSSYAAGDDCVAIKSGWDCFGVDYNVPTSNVTVRNVTCHGFSAGIAIGSELSGGVQNVVVENVTFTKANKPVDIKTSRRRGGFVRNVVYRNVLVQGSIQRGMHVDMFHYNDHPNPDCPANWTPPALTEIANLSFVDMDGRGATYAGNLRFPDEAFHFWAYEESPIRHVHLENVYFPPTKVSWNCSGVVQSLAERDKVTPWPPCQGFDVDLQSLSDSKASEYYQKIQVDLTVV